MTVPFPPAGHVEDSQKRVRVLFNKHFIVDSKKAKLVYVSAAPVHRARRQQLFHT